ncbi:MAG: ABC transporter permease, partial [Acidimicrobiales bacterium]
METALTVPTAPSGAFRVHGMKAASHPGAPRPGSDDVARRDPGWPGGQGGGRAQGGRGRRGREILAAAPALRPLQAASPRQWPPFGLLGTSVLVVAVLVVPLAFLALEASGVGASALDRLIFRSLTETLLWNTVRLTVTVTVLCAIIGTLAAWCVERTDLPGRRIFAVLVVIPFAVPDFVTSFGWASLSTSVTGFRGAVLVMTLGVYPLVYLPVAASLRGADPGLEEAARSLGAGRWRTFWRVTLGHARGAIFGGCVLVALV